MIPIDFPEANFIFTKPADMSDEQCGSLKVFRGQCGDFPGIISKWQPTEEERQAIAEGAGIFLHIVGGGMPPVSLFTEDPFLRNSEIPQPEHAEPE